MPLLNYTTTIPVSRTAAEITTMLGRAGAASVSTRYDQHGPIGLMFELTGPHGPRLFTLPVDVEGMLAVLLKQHGAGQLKRGRPNREQAARVAWRTAREWMAVQLALVEAGMARLDQVMLPYLHVDVRPDGREVTLYERYAEHEQAALTTGGDAR